MTGTPITGSFAQPGLLVWRVAKRSSNRVMLRGMGKICKTQMRIAAVSSKLMEAMKQHASPLGRIPKHMTLALAALAAPASAQSPGRSAACLGPAAYLAAGQSQSLPSGVLQRFALDLGDVERIEIVLTGSAAPAAEAPVEVCDMAGASLAVDAAPNADGTGITVRFTAPAAGRYTLVADAAPGPRTLTLRTTRAPFGDAAPLNMGHTVFARLAPQMPRAWSFEGKAGQWVRIAASSQTDTAIHLVGPAADGKSALLGEDDDSEGLNPLIQRKLHVDGTYIVEVQSLGEEPDDITLDVRELPAPPPPAPPVSLRAGIPLQSTLTSIADRRLYDIAVRTGRSYKVEASAAFDLALDVGLADPIEPASGALASGISVQRTIDITHSGGEVAAFTAAADGHVLLRVRGLGINEGGEDYSLTLTETGR